MLEIDNKKIQCPNCPELLAKVTMEQDDPNIQIFWFHKYENFCMDVFDKTYYNDNQNNQYFTILKDLFNIEIGKIE
jgi:hypothetical protein